MGMVGLVYDGRDVESFFGRVSCFLLILELGAAARVFVVTVEPNDVMPV